MVNAFYITIVTACIVMITTLIAPTVTYADQIIVVQMKGKDVGETRNIPSIEATDTAEGNCFDVPMLDPKNQKRLGTVTRCFTDVKTVEDGMALTETTFLQFEDGTIVARSRPTIQPILDDRAKMTHLISAVPTPYVTNLLVEHSTETYKDMAGSLRYGGIIDLSNFRENNELTFDDLALIKFADIKEQVLHVQKQLKEDQFYTGALDGILGPNTKAAIRTYQDKHGLPKTGELDAATRKALGVQ
jgi:Putative peptidoglycan binding domain